MPPPQTWLNITIILNFGLHAHSPPQTWLTTRGHSEMCCKIIELKFKAWPTYINVSFLLFRNLSAVQDREICCYSISCKEKDNIGKFTSFLSKYSFISFFVTLFFFLFPRYNIAVADFTFQIWRSLIQASKSINNIKSFHLASVIYISQSSNPSFICSSHSGIVCERM